MRLPYWHQSLTEFPVYLQVLLAFFSTMLTFILSQSRPLLLSGCGITQGVGTDISTYVGSTGNLLADLCDEIQTEMEKVLWQSTQRVSLMAKSNLADPCMTGRAAGFRSYTLIFTHRDLNGREYRSMASLDGIQVLC